MSLKTCNCPPPKKNLLDLDMHKSIISNWILRKLDERNLGTIQQPQGWDLEEGFCEDGNGQVPHKAQNLLMRQTTGSFSRTLLRELVTHSEELTWSTNNIERGRLISVFHGQLLRAPFQLVLSCCWNRFTAAILTTTCGYSLWRWATEISVAAVTAMKRRSASTTWLRLWLTTAGRQTGGCAASTQNIS
jgi:hypothetical protein